MTMAGALVTRPRQAVAEDFLPTGLLTDGFSGELRVTSCQLSPQYSALGAARSFARRTVQSWQAENLADDLTLVVSELVANALRHGLGVCMPAAGASGRSQPNGASARPIELSLLSAGSRVMCVVMDPSADVPVRKAPDLATGSGRGLQLIDSLSLFWGWTAVEREQQPVGKAVWAVLALGDKHLDARTV